MIKKTLLLILLTKTSISWSEDLKAILLERDTWEIVKGLEEPPPATAAAREQKEYKLCKNSAYSSIYLNVSKEYRNLITSTENPQEAWDIFKEFFHPHSRARLIGLFDEFFSTHPKEGESIGLYAARLRKLIMQIGDASHKLDDMLQSFQLIRFLPPECSGIVQNIYRWDDKEFKFDKV